MGAGDTPARSYIGRPAATLSAASPAPTPDRKPTGRPAAQRQAKTGWSKCAARVGRPSRQSVMRWPAAWHSRPDARSPPRGRAPVRLPRPVRARLPARATHPRRCVQPARPIGRCGCAGRPPAGSAQSKDPRRASRCFDWSFWGLEMLAEWTGLEPATPGVTGRYWRRAANSYERAILINQRLRGLGCSHLFAEIRLYSRAGLPLGLPLSLIHGGGAIDATTYANPPDLPGRMRGPADP